MATKAHLEGNQRYLATLDDIKVRVPKGKREEYRTIAESQDMSLNAFIVEAVEEKIQRLNCCNGE